MKVEIIDHMGSDLSVVNAARVSFSKESQLELVEERCDCTEICGDCTGFNTYEALTKRDAKLITYLARNKHWTPFGHCFASFRIKAPIFVARQLAKHQVGLVWNEVSRRYVDDEPEFYVPKTWRKRAENVKQGSSNDESMMPYAMDAVFDNIKDLYLDMVHKWDVCPEQARMVLPQSMMTEWIWSGSLAAFARVCALRLDPHTQYETRLIAEDIDFNMLMLFPVSWEALTQPYIIEGSNESPD